MGALGINREIAAKVATTVAAELRFLPVEARHKILNASPVDVKDRLSELAAFQAFMDLVSAERDAHPAAVRAQVLYQNYVSCT